MPEETEKRIRKLLEEDDPGALDLIYEHLGARLFGYAAAMLSSRSDAEDVMQELFVRLADKKERLKRAANLDGYVFMMLKNLLIEQIRRRQRDRARLASFSDHLIVRPEGEGIGKDEIERLNAILDALPSEQKEVIVMKFFQDMTFEEIGRSLGESINTVASRYRYAMEKLRRALPATTNSKLQNPDHK